MATFLILDNHSPILVSMNIWLSLEGDSNFFNPFKMLEKRIILLKLAQAGFHRKRKTVGVPGWLVGQASNS